MMSSIAHPSFSSRIHFVRAGAIAPLIAVVLLSSCLQQNPLGPQAPQAAPCPGSSLTVGATQVCVEIVESSEDVTRGLSGRESLGQDQGMLFIFQYSGVYPFWMKEMKFPLDFIWIADGQVMDLTENVPPPASDPLPLYKPRAPVNQVLEVNAGFVARHGIKIGDKVTLDRKG